METALTRLMRPVKRQGAERYLRLALVAFAASVILTRLFLSLANYPQLGGGTLHLAHLLWGGLLLFVASLLPLILANRWVYPACGILSGLGVGLFIDEVGKFITSNNDYFYPAAAPIIYAFFLLTTLLYLQVRRPRHTDDRTELYQVFEGMSEVLDHDLDPHERAELESRLQAVATRSHHPEYARLASVLLGFLRSDAIHLAAPRPGPLARLAARARALERRVLNRRRLRAALAVALVLLGLTSTAGLALSGVQLVAPGLLPQGAAPQAAPDAGDVAPPNAELPAGPVHPEARTIRAQVALWLRLGLEGVVGLLLLAGGGLLIAGRDRPGVVFGIYGLLVALTTVNLLVFYFDQFGAAADALAQFVVLEGLVHYRRHYLAPEAGPRQAGWPGSEPFAGREL